MCDLLEKYSGMDDVKECHTDLGMYGFDTSHELLEVVLEEIKEYHHDLSAIIMNGDFLAHKSSLKDNSANE